MYDALVGMDAQLMSIHFYSLDSDRNTVGLTKDDVKDMMQSATVLLRPIHGL